MDRVIYKTEVIDGVVHRWVSVPKICAYVHLNFVIADPDGTIWKLEKQETENGWVA